MCKKSCTFAQNFLQTLKIDTIMNVTINAVNFEMADKLEQFIEKK